MEQQQLCMFVFSDRAWEHVYFGEIRTDLWIKLVKSRLRNKEASVTVTTTTKIQAIWYAIFTISMMNGMVSKVKLLNLPPMSLKSDSHRQNQFRSLGSIGVLWFAQFFFIVVYSIIMLLLKRTAFLLSFFCIYTPSFDSKLSFKFEM